MQSYTDPSTHPMYTRSMAVAAHSRAVFRLSGEWGAATSGSRVLTSILQHREAAALRQDLAVGLQSSCVSAGRQMHPATLPTRARLMQRHCRRAGWAMLLSHIAVCAVAGNRCVPG